jgi:hypothetical protein
LKTAVPTPPVAITLHIDGDTDVLFAFRSLDDLPAPPGDFDEEFEQFSMSESRFHEASQRRYVVYDKFCESLNHDIAALVLEALDFNDVKIIVKKSPELVDCWVGLLLKSSREQSRALRNFGLFLASALTYQEEKLHVALELYDVYENQSPSVQIQYTDAHLPLASLAIWLAADHAQVDERRFSRLDCCQNDHQIATEVSAALYAGRSEVLDAYINSRLNSSLPVDVARAIMVVGFSDNEDLASKVLQLHDDHKGLLGESVKACRFAMDRHRWTKHWFQEMQIAQSPEDFWLASVLFLKIVDGRYTASHRQTPLGGATFNQWWWSVARQIKSRLKSWENKREKKLFGSDVPSSIFCRANLSVRAHS